jgi:hypothetical protein
MVAINIVLNEKLKSLEPWRTPNTVCMLSMMLGTVADDSCFGPDVKDASAIIHRGIGNVVLPVLAIQDDTIRAFYQRAKKSENENNLHVFDFTEAAQSSKRYDEYQQKLSQQKLADQLILGLALIGEPKVVRSLCGSLPRWR